MISIYLLIFLQQTSPKLIKYYSTCLIFVDNVECSLGVDARQCNEHAWHDSKHDALHRQTAERLLLINAEKEAACNEAAARHHRLGDVPLENQHREYHDEYDCCWPRDLIKSITHSHNNS